MPYVLSMMDVEESGAPSIAFASFDQEDSYVNSDDFSQVNKPETEKQTTMKIDKDNDDFIDG